MEGLVCVYIEGTLQSWNSKRFHVVLCIVRETWRHTNTLGMAEKQCSHLPHSRGSLGGGILTSDGSTPQISRAYSVMVRSLENFPEAAMFLITVLVHSFGFWLIIFKKEWRILLLMNEQSFKKKLLLGNKQFSLYRHCSKCRTDFWEIEDTFKLQVDQITNKWSFSDYDHQLIINRSVWRPLVSITKTFSVLRCFI